MKVIHTDLLSEYESLLNAGISTCRQDNSVSKVRGDMKVIQTDLL